MVIKNLREKIDAVDIQIVHLLDERAALVKRIGEYKACVGANVYDPAREQAVMERVSSLAENMSPEDIKEIYALIMKLSKGMQV